MAVVSLSSARESSPPLFVEESGVFTLNYAADSLPGLVAWKLVSVVSECV